VREGWNYLLLRHPSVQTTCSGSYWCTVVCTLVRLCMDSRRWGTDANASKNTQKLNNCRWKVRLCYVWFVIYTSVGYTACLCGLKSWR